MSLINKAKEIEDALYMKIQSLHVELGRLSKERLECIEEYKLANTGDRSENAPLEAAIRHMSETNSAMLVVSTQLHQLDKIHDIKKYNSVGIVLPYSTVLLECNGEEHIYRIFPDDISFVEFGIISVKSRLAAALLGKVVGDVVEVDHTSKKISLSWTIKEIY